MSKFECIFDINVHGSVFVEARDEDEAEEKFNEIVESGTIDEHLEYDTSDVWLAGINSCDESGA